MVQVVDGRLLIINVICTKTSAIYVREKKPQLNPQKIEDF